MRYDAFIGGSYEAEAWTADCERTVNWIPVKVESPGATAHYALLPTPGVTALSTSGNGPGRAHYYGDGREFAVIGATLYEINQQGALTSRGTVDNDGSPATISSNGAGGGQLFITAGSNGYVYSLSANTLTLIANLVGKATMGDYVDGYFVCLDTATSTWYFSGLLDGATWTTGTNFEQRNLGGDPWLSMKVHGRYIWLLGEKTTEVWYNNGGSPNPFSPVDGVLITNGAIWAPWSRQVLGSRLIWLGRVSEGRIAVLAAEGFAPQAISTDALEAKIEHYSDSAGAVGDVYGEGGHSYYALNFDGDEITWVWDSETGLWSERGAWTGDHYAAWRPRFHAQAFGESRILDAGGGSVYRLDSSLTTDVDGANIRRLRRAPALADQHRRISYPGLEIELDAGQGNAVDPGSNPQVMLRMSNDGGRTWGPEQMRPAGKVGEYGTRVRWNRLGSARRRVFEVVVSDSIPWRLTGANLTPDPITLGA